VLVRDLPSVLCSLSTWELFEANDGRLTRLAAECVPSLDAHSLWRRPTSADPWAIELLLDEADGETWVYRREPRIRRPMPTVVRRSSDGLPYLAPEIQLLYKSKGPREIRRRSRHSHPREFVTENAVVSTEFALGAGRDRRRLRRSRSPAQSGSMLLLDYISIIS
jgi:hypothetical protein